MEASAMRRFHLVLKPDKEDHGYTVIVPSLPGCVTEGDTVEEAIANAKAAIALYMDLLTEQGEDIPEDADAVITTVEV